MFHPANFIRHNFSLYCTYLSIQAIAGPSVDHFGFNTLPDLQECSSIKLHFRVGSDSDFGYFLLKKMILSQIMYTRYRATPSRSFGYDQFRVRLGSV